MKKFDPDEIVRYEVRFARSDKMETINGKKFYKLTDFQKFYDMESAKHFAETKAFFNGNVVSAKVVTVFGDGLLSRLIDVSVTVMGGILSLIGIDKNPA
nr:MAG TPA: hypothetical protein [Caudoviricetes sp.]